MTATIRLEKVEDLIEARKRFWLFEEKLPELITNLKREGRSVNEAGVVMISAAFQSFVEDVFLECSFKLFGRDLVGLELKKYRKTWSRWGNPNSENIILLFRRLDIDDVFSGLNIQGIEREDFIKQLNALNSVRNSIAHGNPPTHNGRPIAVNLSRLEKWKVLIDRASRAFRFHALHSSGLGMSAK
ncbi:MAG: hypothetical protein LJE68_16390 [Rhodobacter sp.]|nr:hypothetical protein [Rhodobacter sp.]